MSEDHSDDEEEEGWSPEKDKDPMDRLMNLLQRSMDKVTQPSQAVGCDFDSVLVRRISNGFVVCYHELPVGSVSGHFPAHRELYAPTLDGVKEILVQKFGPEPPRQRS